MSVQFGPTMLRVLCNGRNGAGTISVSGLKAGDLIIRGVFTDAPPDETFPLGSSGFCEATITVDDEIQQFWTANFSVRTLDILLVRWP